MYFNQQILQKYVNESEVRNVNDDLCFRLMPENAKKFDSGLYGAAKDFWADLVKEITKIDIKYPNHKRNIFYVYWLPDDFYEKTMVPQLKNILGRAVESKDTDAFADSLGYIQKCLTDEMQNDKENVFNRVSKLHEFSHLIHGNFGKRERYLDEGVAEIIPWYILGYEKRVPTHLTWMRSLPKIHTLNDFMTGKVSYVEKVGKKISSYKSAYVSAYLICRAVISNIEKKYKISPVDALQKYLDLWYSAKCDGMEFIMQIANMAAMDTDKLIYTTEYQNQVLTDIEHENKNNIIIETKERI